MEDVPSAAVETLTAGLVELGLLEGRLEDLVEERAYEAHFPHQTSHWLGLDVHDVGDYRTDFGSRSLEPGMVLTVEPGLYLSAGSERVPSHLAGIGIRIEDDLLVTEEGAENLTEAAPVGPGEIEELVGSTFQG